MSAEDANSKQRIDMGHGFMKSVIRNQIDRDNYDKEVKAKQTSGKPHSRPRRQKKPEMQTYMIPNQRSKNDGSGPLFSLEYQHKNGDIMKINISQTDQSLQVARRVGSRYNLPEPFVTALAERLQQEMDASCTISTTSHS